MIATQWGEPHCCTTPPRTSLREQEGTVALQTSRCTRRHEAHTCRQLRDLSAMNRHRMIMKHMGATKSRPSFLKTDADTLRDHHQFIRDDGGFVSDEAPWGERLAARYYSKLLKEYAVCELSGYREGRVGLRWRTEQEVVVGKGQFECGSLACGAMQGLQSYEVPFKYVEQDQRKQARSLSLCWRLWAIELVRWCKRGSCVAKPMRCG